MLRFGLVGCGTHAQWAVMPAMTGRSQHCRLVAAADICPENESNFRWAVGADLPIFSILSVRASFDSGKIRNAAGQDVTYNYWGIGASIGLGGMR